MSITLITGVPGSGKTLKAVWDHLRKDVGKVTAVQDEWGNDKTIQTKVYTNINSLQVDHELIEIGGTWAKVGAEWKYEGNPESLRNWHQWAKPGSKIYADEFQKAWPPRPNGSPVPPDIQALDTHRHMGVDFVVITQNCRNVDRHLLGLVDRHLHVRRVANFPLATVYEWDHASVSLNYKNSFTKSPWRYPKQAYKLYKSAELHTKQSRKMPAVVWFILAGLCGVAYAFPTLKTRLTERVMGKPPEATSAQAAATPNSKQEYVKDGVKYTVETTTTEGAPLPLQVASSPLQAASMPMPPAIAGCIAAPAQGCKCFDQAGKKVDEDPDMCPTIAGKSGEDLQYVRETPSFIAPIQQQPQLISLSGTARGASN